jgi:chromosome partitioning protein
MGMVISSVGTKGGTGKTSLTKFMAITLKQQGKKVLIIDLCQNSDVATQFGYRRENFEWDAYEWVSEQVSFEEAVIHDEETGVHFIPASNYVEKIQEYAEKKRRSNPNYVLKEKLSQIKEQYDFIFLDNHPTETTKMMTMSLLASEFALVPTVLSIGSVVATLRTVGIIKDLQEEGVPISYTVVPMNVDHKMRRELEDLKKSFIEEYGITDITSSHIRYSVVVKKAGLNGEIIKHDNPYMEKVMEDYRLVTNEIVEMLRVPTFGRG